MTMETLVEQLKKGESPSYHDMKEVLVSHFPLLAKLKKTPQDPVWHAEGDVEVHTSMVVEELYKQLDQREYEGEIRAVLVLAALFHDIAKPLTTRERERDGRTQIIAPRHADRGRSYLAYKVLDLGLSYEGIRTLLNLVGLHHEPKWLVIKGKDQKDFALLKRLVEPEYLYVLEMADMLGRDCADQGEQIEHIEFFKMFCKEFDVWGRDSDPFKGWFEKVRESMGSPDDFAYIERATTQGFYDWKAGHIYTPEEAAARGMANGAEFPELVLMCGPSGSGKSSWIRNNLSDHDVVSLDAIREEITGSRSDQSQNGRVLQAAKERLKKSLRANRKVVWDATNTRRDFRSLPMGIAHDYGAHTTLTVFHLRDEDFFSRNKDREHSIPDPILRKQIDSVEFPNINDAHRVLFVDGNAEILYDTREHL